METGYGVATFIAPAVGPETGDAGVGDAIGGAASSFVNWLSGADKKKERAAKYTKEAAELELQTLREQQAFQLQLLQLQAAGGDGTTAPARTIFGLPMWAAGLGAAGVAVALWLVLKD